MTEYGITVLNNKDALIPVTGFTPKTYDAILEALVTYCQKEFGGDIDLTPTSPLFILLQGFAQQYAEMWAGLEELYYARNIETAIGNDLDNIGLAVGLPRYRPVKSRGNFEFTRLRDPITGVFYRLDNKSKTVLPIPPYTYYYTPNLEELPCEQWTVEYLENRRKAQEYADYFKKPLPKIIVPEGLQVTLTGNEGVVYQVEVSGYIESNIIAENAYTTSLPVECNIWGPDGDLDSYYKRTAYFPGAITKAINDTLNPYVSSILSIYQEEGLYAIDVGVSTTTLTIHRREPYTNEMILCNCWHYYDPMALQPNGGHEYIQMPMNWISSEELHSALVNARNTNPRVPAITVVTQLFRDWVYENIPTYRINNRAENIELKWISPNNTTLFCIDFRNISIDDDSTWFIPDPSDESNLLFTYFRPVKDRYGTVLEESLDYLIFRPLINTSLQNTISQMSFQVLYAGFGGVSEEFYTSDAGTQVRGYIGPNHISVVRGGFLLPQRSDIENATLFCRPRTYISSGHKLNIGYALQKETISGGRDYESDIQYKHRIKTTTYHVTSTGPAIEQYVTAVEGVQAAKVYDTHLIENDPLSIGFKVRVQTSDSSPVSLNNEMNNSEGKLINDLVQLVKPAGVQYTFDTGTGFGIAVDIVVVGQGYTEEEIVANVKRVLDVFIKSLSFCKPLDYSYITDRILSCASGVKIIKSMRIFNGAVKGSGYTIPNDGRSYLNEQFNLVAFGAPYYVPQNAYAYFDETRSTITVVQDQVVYYGGCGRSNDCNQ